jgi:hypothetical protein
MAEDVAGTVKTAVGTAVATVTGLLSKTPATKAPVKRVAKKSAGEEGCVGFGFGFGRFMR